jgi:hypothetical protein
MKAYYKTVLREKAPPGGLAVDDYQLLEITDVCCKRMNEALDEEAIRFGGFDREISSDNNINFSKCSPYPEGAEWDDYEVHFCPFCGKKVETEERERVVLKRVERPVTTIEIAYVEEGK